MHVPELHTTRGDLRSSTCTNNNRHNTTAVAHSRTSTCLKKWPTRQKKSAPLTVALLATPYISIAVVVNEKVNEASAYTPNLFGFVLRTCCCCCFFFQSRSLSSPFSSLSFSILLRGIYGTHKNQIYFPIFTNNISSYLLWPPVLLRGTIVNRTCGIL